MKFKIKNDINLKQWESFKRRRGMKNSTRRAFVVDHFLSKDRHYSIDELYQEIRRKKPGIGYSTIYRALKSLVRSGLASECVFADGLQRFEPEHSAKHHDHLVCRKCGRIIEFENSDIEELQRKIALDHGFIVDAHELKLYGECKKCKKNPNKRKIG